MARSSNSAYAALRVADLASLLMIGMSMLHEGLPFDFPVVSTQSLTRLYLVVSNRIRAPCVPWLVPGLTYDVVRVSLYWPAPTLLSAFSRLSVCRSALPTEIFWPSARPGPSSWIATIPGWALSISRATDRARRSQWREVPMSAREVRTLKVAKRT